MLCTVCFSKDSCFLQLQLFIVINHLFSLEIILRPPAAGATPAPWG